MAGGPPSPDAAGWSLQTKTALSLAVAMLGLVVVMYLPLRHLVLDSFADLEAREAARNLERAQEALADELAALGRAANDYGAWDDTYDFIGDPTNAYVALNYFDDNFVRQRWNAIVISDSAGEVRLARGFDLEKREVAEVPAGLTDLATRSPAVRPADPEVRAGIAPLDGGLILVAARAVVPSLRKGEARGYLLVARRLDADLVARLAQAIRLDVAVVVDGPVPPASTFAPLDGATMLARAPLLSLDGRPAGLLEVRLDRALYAEGQRTVLYLLGVMLAVGMATAAVMLVFLRRLVLARLRRLSDMAERVRATGDLSARSDDHGRDELFVLARSMDTMLASIQELMQLLDAERDRSDKLLRNVLPGSIAERLKRGEHPIADAFDDATIVFVDLVGFTQLSSRLSPRELVAVLGELFSDVDALTELHGLEKVKTIGDAYMAAAGVVTPRDDHAEAAVRLGLDMLACVDDHNQRKHLDLAMRVGISSGPVVAGVIGEQRLIYDVWGDAVNTASRMESTGVPGRVHVSLSTYDQVRHAFTFEELPPIDVKGKGKMQTFLVVAGANETARTG
jgi:adenylate cyclase